MARIQEPTPEQEAAWKEWVAARPDNVRVVAERFDPWSLYRMKSTGHRVTLASFGEGADGAVTLRVRVTGHFNVVVFDREVFGVDPNDLESCEAPTEGEATGTVLTEEDEIDKFVDAVRPFVLANRQRG